MADSSKPVPFIKDLRVAMHKHLGGERCPATVTVYEAIEPVATSYALRFQVSLFVHGVNARVLRIECLAS